MLNLLVILSLLNAPAEDTICRPTFNLSAPSQMVWDGTRYIAVGSSVFTSPDGRLWTNQGYAPGSNFLGVKYNGNHYVAYTYFGLFYSQDGVTWEEANSSSGSQGLIWNGTQWLIWGGNRVSVSTDGRNWTGSTAVPSFYTGTDSVVWGAGYYVAAGSPCSISQDGLVWSDLTFSASSIHFEGQKFFALGNGTHNISDNGTDWVTYPQPQIQGNGLAYNGSDFVLAGSSGVYRSANGTEWVKAATLDDVDNVLWSGEGFMTYPALYHSVDGQSWTELGLRAETEFPNQSSAIYTDGLGHVFIDGALVTGTDIEPFISANQLEEIHGVYFARAYEYKLYSSLDGRHWDLISTGQHSPISYDNNQWFFFRDGLRFTSSDGVTWRADLKNWYDANTFYANGFYYQTEGTSRRSQDGVRWESIDINGISQILWTGSNYFALTSYDGVFRSADGVTWEPVTNPSNPRQIHYFDGKVFLVGSNQVISSSDEGEHWVSAYKGENITAFSYSGTEWALVDFDNVYLSDNGMTWTPQYMPPSSLSSLVYIENEWVGVDYFQLVHYPCLDKINSAVPPVAVFPWVVANQTWYSRLALHNSNKYSAQVTLVAEDQAGHKQTQTTLIPPNGLFSETAEDLFPGMNGYNVQVYSSNVDLQPTFVTFNENPEAGLHSPAQAEGVMLGNFTHDLLFSYITGADIPAVTLSNLKPDTSETIVSFTLTNAEGVVLAQEQRTLLGSRPFAATVASLFSDVTLPAEGSVRATAPIGSWLAGTSFIFNHLGQPAMDRAHTIYAP